MDRIGKAVLFRVMRGDEVAMSKKIEKLKSGIQQQNNIVIWCVFLVAVMAAMWVYYTYLKKDLPNYPPMDEEIVALRAFDLFRGKNIVLNYFKYPSLSIYVGKGLFHLLNPIIAITETNYTYILRGAFTFFALISYVFVFLGVKKLENSKGTALLSALFGIFSLFQFCFLYYVGPDLLMVFFANGLFLSAVYMFKCNDADKNMKCYIPIFCILCGLAMSVKYNAVLAGILLVCVFCQKKYYKNIKYIYDTFRNLILIVLTFVVVNFSVFFHFETFIEDFKWNFTHYQTGHVGADCINPVMEYTKLFFVGSYGFIGGILVICGAAWLFYSKKYSEFIFLSILPLITILIQGKYKIMFPRNNTLIMVYSYCFMSMSLPLFEKLLIRLKAKYKADKGIPSACGYSIHVVIIFINICILLGYSNLKNNYLVESENWINENIPVGSTIYLQTFADIYAPKLDQSKYNIIYNSDVFSIPENIDENVYVVFDSSNMERYLKREEGLLGYKANKYYEPDNRERYLAFVSKLELVHKIGEVAAPQWGSFEILYTNLFRHLFDGSDVLWGWTNIYKL
ncbi:hypothetical protein LQZ18_06910 [Lachnospiraceae bacterium ZAX-1]